MKVLLVHNYYQLRGGEDTVFEAEFHMLRRGDVEVDVFTTSNNAILTAAQQAWAFANVIYNPFARATLRKHLKSNRPDIVHVHNFFPRFSPSIYDACRSANIPVVQTLHNHRITCISGSYTSVEEPLDHAPFQMILRRSYRGSLPGSLAVAMMTSVHRLRDTWNTRLDRIIALTEFSRSKFTTAGVDPARIVVKPNFVEDSGVGAATGRAGALFAGRMSIEKGVLPLTKLWREIDYPLWIAGSGPLEAAVRSAAAGTRATLLGNLENADVRAQMRKAAFLLLPSRSYEAMPVTLVEAFASGLPIIAYRHSALAELIEDRKTGLLVPPGDERALLATIEWAIANPARMAEMGSAAREVYEQKYTPEANFKQLTQIYSDVIAEHRRKHTPVGGPRVAITAAASATSNAPRSLLPPSPVRTMASMRGIAASVAPLGKQVTGLTKAAAFGVIRQAHLRFSRHDLPRRLAIYFHELEPTQHAAFRQAMAYLQDQGYVSVGADAMLANEGPQRQMFVSFDDNYQSWHRALPVLAETGVKALFYVNTMPMRDRASAGDIAAYFDRIAFRGDRTPLSTAELSEIAAAGHGIGCHSHSHFVLSQLPQARWDEEIKDCRARLEDMIAAPVEHFAYPYGMRRFFSEPLRQYCLKNGLRTIATAIPCRQFRQEPIRSIVHRSRWQLDRSIASNLDNLCIDGHVFERWTGRSAMG